MSDVERIYLPDLIPDYPFETYEEHLFDGKTATMQRWPKDRVRELIQALRRVDFRSREVVYDKLPPCWLIAIADHVLSPKRSYHWTKYLDGRDMEFMAFSIGEQNPETSGITFDVREADGDIYIHVIADKPSLAGHNYDPAGYFKTVAPEIPGRRNVYIHASAPTFVILSAEKTYAPKAKSVSISFAHDLDDQGHRLYTCCYTTSGEKELGDTHRLLPEWDEWPFFLKKP